MSYVILCAADVGAPEREVQHGCRLILLCKLCQYELFVLRCADALLCGTVPGSIYLNKNVDYMNI